MWLLPPTLRRFLKQHRKKYTPSTSMKKTSIFQKKHVLLHFFFSTHLVFDWKKPCWIRLPGQCWLIRSDFHPLAPRGSLRRVLLRELAEEMQVGHWWDNRRWDATISSQLCSSMFYQMVAVCNDFIW